MAATRPSWASSEATRRSMRANRSKDTGPERALRSALHRLGLRYRTHAAPLAGVRLSVDVVFPRRRVAVFVDGCFWHGCPQHEERPKMNVAFWAGKIAGNRRRDARVDELLRQAGWTVVRVWEHEDPVVAAARVAAIVAAAPLSPPRRRARRRRWPA